MEQYTIERVVNFEGVGLHTGIKVKAAFLPMAIDSGIQFQRIDLFEKPYMEADVAYVVATERGTILEKKGMRVATVEHVLAAITGMQIDNICIQLDGAEIPDLDGSAVAFVELLLKAGRLPQGAARKLFSLKEKFIYNDPDTRSYFEFYPDTDYSLHCSIAYNRWPLEHQYATLCTLQQFKEEIAPARTFIYLDEIAALYRKGLLQGGDAIKAVILSDSNSNQELLTEVAQLSGKKIDILVEPGRSTLVGFRYNNEPARHKLLDLMGDLALVGSPLKGRIFAHNPGHGPNTRFAAALKKAWLKSDTKVASTYDLYAPSIFDIEKIKKMLPHRYPFQLVDKIIQLEEGSITGIKNVTINEPFFQGHFPSYPIMPGVLQVEALAQTAAILVLHQIVDPENYLTYFLSIDKCKFRRPVVPGDILVLTCKLLSDIKSSTSENKSISRAKVEGRGFVKGELACEAILLAQIVKQHERAVH